MLTNVRVWFKKTGVLRFISHLDLNRLFLVAFKKSKLPLWYTEGFNPHIYITFNTPLSLGFESTCESFDIKLVEDIKFDEFILRLNSHLPEGIETYKVAYPQYKANEITLATYEISFRGNYKKELDAFLLKPEILTEKTTKKKTKTIDLKPLIKNYKIEETEEKTIFTCTVSAGLSENLNPSLLMGAFTAETGVKVENFRCVRIAILVTPEKAFQ